MHVRARVRVNEQSVVSWLELGLESLQRLENVDPENANPRPCSQTLRFKHLSLFKQLEHLLQLKTLATQHEPRRAPNPTSASGLLTCARPQELKPKRWPDPRALEIQQPK